MLRNKQCYDEAWNYGSKLIIGNEKIVRKNRDSRIKKVPFNAYVGEKELKKDETFCSESTEKGDLGNFSLEEFICLF